MTTTTTLGYTMPEDSDPVADLAATVRALAQQIDDKLGLVACGTADVSMSGTANATAAVVFPVGRFSATPKVTTGSENGNFDAYIESVSSTGCTIRCKHRAGTNTSAVVPVAWIAVQQ